MKHNSPSFCKWMSTRKKQPRRKQLTSKMASAIERAWHKFLRGGQRPPLTCIIIGGIEKEKEIIRMIYD